MGMSRGGRQREGMGFRRARHEMSPNRLPIQLAGAPPAGISLCSGFGSWREWGGAEGNDSLSNIAEALCQWH